MVRFPDLRIAAERQRFLCFVAQWRVLGGTKCRPAHRLQWRDRVGFAPTFPDHRDASFSSGV